MAYVFNPFTGTFDDTGPSSGGAIPTRILANKTFAVAANSQALFSEPIDLDMGAEISFDENSVLVEVN